METSAPGRGARPVVVVVEDEDDVRNLVTHHLRPLDLDVVSVGSIAAATHEIERRAPALVVLDRMLPDGDGTELCARIRADERLFDVAVLMLTARGEEMDRVAGLAVGADDYVVKPFSVRELVARVRVLVTMEAVRRLARTLSRSGELYRWRDLIIDVERQRVVAAGMAIELRPLELKLLVALCRARGAVLTRRDLRVAIWGEDLDVRPRLVDMHVWRLRGRLGTHGEAVETVLGLGYRLAAE
jgi:DNA-binding response OmpR family regulator